MWSYVHYSTCLQLEEQVKRLEEHNRRLEEQVRELLARLNMNSTKLLWEGQESLPRSLTRLNMNSTKPPFSDGYSAFLQSAKDAIGAIRDSCPSRVRDKRSVLDVQIKAERHDYEKTAFGISKICWIWCTSSAQIYGSLSPTV